jgi:UDP-N-acetylmuramate--alanine ligase
LKSRFTENFEGQTFVLAGVGGVGMSALAQMLLARGAQVLGTDRLCDQGTQTPTLSKLKSAGVEMRPQDGGALTKDVAALVVSTAVEDDNPDVIAAASLGIPIRHRSEVLSAAIAGQRCIAVGGTSGKSTITGMLGWIFEQCGLDPTVINGAPLVDWARPDRVGNFRAGASDIAIIEADESDRSLLRFQPEFSTISNISRDHFELDETVAIFRRFAELTSRETILGPGVDPEQFTGRTFQARGIFDDAAGRFIYHGTEFKSPLPGRHNLENALVAAALCEHFGIALETLRDALQSFGGIERRFQIVGSFKGARVVDDYAHNPAKIAAAWRTAAAPDGRVIAVWRPHGFGPLHAMRSELTDTFRRLCRAEDILFILPVYYAGGTTSRKIDSEEFVRGLVEARISAKYLTDYQKLHAELESLATPGDTILLMGARDPQISEFARMLARQDCPGGNI